MGKTPAPVADVVKARVEALLSAKLIGCLPDEENARWLASASPALVAKLAAVGLIEERIARVLPKPPPGEAKPEAP